VLELKDLRNGPGVYLGRDSRIRNDKRYHRVLAKFEEMYGPVLCSGWKGVLENLGHRKFDNSFIGTRYDVFHMDDGVVVLSGVYDVVHHGRLDFRHIGLKVSGQSPTHEKTIMVDLVGFIETELAADRAEHGLE
jgi:hypothetical protein